MMSFLPKDELEPDNGGKKPVSSNRIVIWVIVSAVGLYLIGTGVYGILTK